MIYLLRPHILLITGQSRQPVEDFIYYVGFPQLTNTCKSIHTILKVKTKFNPIHVNLYSEANAQ